MGFRNKFVMTSYCGGRGKLIQVFMLQDIGDEKMKHGASLFVVQGTTKKTAESTTKIGRKDYRQQLLAMIKYIIELKN